ncbi:unnamed protein product [Camellia sinensis]
MYGKALHGELAGDIAVVGRLFGISIISAIRVGLLLAPGEEFAFVAFGEAVNQGIMSCQMSSLLFLVVGVSIALTPWLAAGGQLLASRFELHDVWSLLPVDYEAQVRTRTRIWTRDTAISEKWGHDKFFNFFINFFYFNTH